MHAYLRSLYPRCSAAWASSVINAYLLGHAVNSENNEYEFRKRGIDHLRTVASKSDPASRSWPRDVVHVPGNVQDGDRVQHIRQRSRVVSPRCSDRGAEQRLIRRLDRRHRRRPVRFELSDELCDTHLRALLHLPRVVVVYAAARSPLRPIGGLLFLCFRRLWHERLSRHIEQSRISPLDGGDVRQDLPPVPPALVTPLFKLGVGYLAQPRDGILA